MTNNKKDRDLEIFREGRRRERELRSVITNYIHEYVKTQTKLIPLDFPSQCRQLSYALGDSGNELLSSLNIPQPIARHSSEMSGLTHYVRAAIASAISVEVKNIILPDDVSINNIIEYGKSSKDICYSRIALWSKIIDMLSLDKSLKPLSVSTRLSIVESNVRIIMKKLNMKDKS